ncbi:MAG: hypothetical protein KDB35_07375 [Acidimicrobiales bacterium]|nr:hypothetical protein [Acidimicrobiales bacterium]
MIVGIGDLHGWAASPFLLAGTSGAIVSTWQLWGPLVGRGGTHHRSSYLTKQRSRAGQRLHLHGAVRRKG